MGEHVNRFLRCALLTVLVFPQFGFAQSRKPATTRPPAGKEAGFVEPARYPLELVLPREAESSPSTADDSPSISANHRIFRAYPKIEYNIRAVVVGGAYPFTFELADAPAGMTIDKNTGEIRWPSPTGTRVKPTITVTDAEGTIRSSAWEIRITQKEFRFVDAERGNDANSGTINQPWKTLAKVKSSEAQNTTLYFRSGVYKTADLQPTGDDEGGWKRAEFNGRIHPVQWLAYPGEKPVIDSGYRGDNQHGWFIRLQGAGSNPVYLDGLEFTRAWHIGLQFVSGVGDFAVFRRLSIHDIAETIRGANSAGIMTMTNPARPSWYSAFQDIDFHHNSCGGIKQYSQRKLLWEDCKFRDSGIGPDLKSDISRFEVRTCLFVNNRNEAAGLFGNLHPARGRDITGEIRFNRMLCPDPRQQAMDVNQDGLANEIHLYRNTFVGVVRVRNTDSEDGPFHFVRNVIVNASSSPDHIQFEAVSAPNRIVSQDNLSGTPSDQIVDAEGNLTGKSRSWIGTRGHQVVRSE